MCWIRFILSVGRGRQSDRECRAAAGSGAVGADASAMELDDALDDREPKAGGTLAAGRLRGKLLEAPEQARAVVLGKAGAFVLHADNDAPFVRGHRQLDLASDRA